MADVRPLTVDVDLESPVFDAIQRAATEMARVQGEECPDYSAKYYRGDAQRIVFAALGLTIVETPERQTDASAQTGGTDV